MGFDEAARFGRSSRRAVRRSLRDATPAGGLDANGKPVLFGGRRARPNARKTPPSK